MKRVTFHRLAELELVEAVEFYDQSRRGLGDEFLDEVERAIIFLDRYPKRRPKRDGRCGGSLFLASLTR
jgi:hypothetical protein